MKKYLTSIFAGLAVGVLATTSAHAIMNPHAYSEYPDIKGRWGIGLNASAALVSGDEADADNDVYYGGVVSYGVLDYLAIEIGFGFHETSWENNNVDFGDIEQMPLMLNLQWRYPFEMGTTPMTGYAITGAGIVFQDFEESDTVEAIPRTIDVEDAFAFRLGLGLDVFVTRNMALNLEGSYTFVTEDLLLAAPELGVGSQEVTTGFVHVGGGLKYYF